MTKSTPPLPRFRRTLVAAIILAFFLGGCGSGSDTTTDTRSSVRIKGSDTMLLLTTRWAEDFMRVHPRIAVYADGGGTETGIEALIEGETDLCAASRTLRAEEVRRLLQKRGSLGISVLTAKDALSVYLHPDNPVGSLTIEQITGLFTGEIRNWRTVGGADLPVTVISRPPNSGTFLFFEEHVLQGRPYSRDAETVASTDAVIRRVRELPGAIGYGGLPFGEDLRHVAVDGIKPTADNVRNGSYPISRYLYLYASRPLEGELKLFVDWVLSNAGQTVVRNVGYIPLWEVPSDGK
ncbi:MAG: PstS family phosphate ABC transporter substrate-binding protein [Bacteroidia bacterium]|nr:PstS family phosphate ABC transporter substrate-binding protein [Bacteroidia bacterium]